MSLGCLRLTLDHAVRGACCSTTPVPLLLLSGPRAHRLPWGQLGLTFPFCTVVGGSGETTQSPPQKRKKQDQKTRATISSVGRKIHQRHLQLLSEQGENMGVVHRADALRLLDEKGLKLIAINEHSDPPVYRLMSGKQIHEEQMKLREKEKTKGAGSIQVKVQTLSSDIALHDLDTKLWQVANWLEKHHHVKLTLKARGGSSGSNNTALDTVLDKMVQKLQVPSAFVMKPKIIKDGRSATCVLRPPSAKELQQQVAQQRAQVPNPDHDQQRAQVPNPDHDQQPPSSTSQSDQSNDSPQQ
ncbi:translation initiation factor IF-3, mitochondrial [Brachyhypopomus gauderio]|uniref:translation initiation factor IF-3, mitochondrial n=1 Tax=Brachyhypopomus gauderio TaxID=698409 RepID=UPI00404185D1